MAFLPLRTTFTLLATAVSLAATAIPACASDSSAGAMRVITADRGEGASKYNERKGGVLKVKFGVLTLVAEYFEYNPGTCAEISPGMWTVKKTAKYGTVSTGTGSYTIPSGDDCAGNTYTTATVNYTWTDSSTTKTHDRFIAYWTTPDGEFDYEEKAKIKLVK
jgi:hypothetical protein